MSAQPTGAASIAAQMALGVEIRQRRADLLRQMGQHAAVVAAWVARPLPAKLKLDAAKDDHRVTVGMPHAPAALRQPYALLQRAEWTLAMTGERFAMARAATLAARTQRPVADLCQDALIGLHRAAISWEPERGVSFLTYARWWIRWGMHEGLATAMAPVTITHDRRRDRERIERETATGRPTATFREAQLLGVAYADLDTTPLAVDTSAMEARMDAADTLARPLATLPPADRELLHRVFWLGQEQGEIAEERGCTRQAVSARQVRILTTLRAAL